MPCYISHSIERVNTVTAIAVFASGRGSNFRSLVQHIQDGQLSCRIAVFITDNSRAPALQFARESGLPVQVIHPKQFSTACRFGEALLEVLDAHQVDWIVLAGYLKKIPANVVARYANRIVNIHPALLPAFGGKGMYGMRVHQAVFEAGVQVTGVTIHLVNEDYDAGPIVWQEPVVIRECNSPEAIARRVLEVEHRLYPKVLEELITRKPWVDGKRVRWNEAVYDSN